MEIAVLLLFTCLLILCVVTGISLLYALAAGFVLFFLYTLHRGFSVRETLSLSLEGIRTVKNILLTFIFIGMLTGIWRACGTIPSIVCFSVRLISPTIFLMLTFLLNSLISFLTGTSLGSAATMGSVTMTIGLALGMEPVWLGGAILSGIYFGDRCSPVSTSAILVAELTKTDIFDNIRGMVRTSLVPFVLTCVIYLILGALLPRTDGELLDVTTLFLAEFRLGWLPLIPAAVVLILALCKVKVRLTMLASIICGVLIAFFYQGLPAASILHILIFGFTAKDLTVQSMLNGGGITSMVKVGAIVCLSSSYSGLFRATGLLNPVQSLVHRASEKCAAFPVILISSVLICLAACNQTLTIMLTNQICGDLVPDKKQFAIDLENSAVIASPLIPWCIAGAAPIAMLGAPTLCLAAACYLYLVPLWNLWYRDRYSVKS